MPYYKMNLKDKEQITYGTDDYQLIVDIHINNDFAIYELKECDGSVYKTIEVGKIAIDEWRKIRSKSSGDVDAYVIEIFLGISEK